MLIQKQLTQYYWFWSNNRFQLGPICKTLFNVAAICTSQTQLMSVTTLLQLAIFDIHALLLDLKFSMAGFIFIFLAYPTH